MKAPLFDVLFWRYAPVRKLTRATIVSSGRNNRGRITSFHRGGGVSRRYRLIDFSRRLLDIPAAIVRFEKDPFRSAPLCLLCYSNGVLSYILAVRDLLKGRRILAGSGCPAEPANAMPLSHVPLGYFIHNIAGSYIRVCGQKAQVLRQSNNATIVRMASQEIRSFSNKAFATIGTIQKPRIVLSLRKAGRSRWLNRRPHVRGVAMNPISHPHGGGEGKTSGGRPSCSPWGILTKGYKTRNPRKNVTNILKTRVQYAVERKKKRYGCMNINF